MLLSELLISLQSEVVLERITAEQYARSKRRLSQHLGRSATIDDLNIDTINKYLIWLKSEFDLSNTSIRNYRAGILRMWNYASDRYGHMPCIARRVRAPVKDPVVVRAWSLPSLALLMTAAEGLPGQLRCGIPANVFMSAWVWVGYETGLRPGDIRELTWREVDLEGMTITVCQHKTRKVHTAMLGERSCTYLKALKAYGQKEVFPLNKWGVRRWEGFLYARAEKLGFVRLKGQGIGTLRKSHATQVHAEHGIAAAAESLGHTSGISTARNHYVDAKSRTGFLPKQPGESEGRRTG